LPCFCGEESGCEVLRAESSHSPQGQRQQRPESTHHQLQHRPSYWPRGRRSITHPCRAFSADDSSLAFCRSLAFLVLIGWPRVLFNEAANADDVDEAQDSGQRYLGVAKVGNNTQRLLLASSCPSGCHPLMCPAYSHTQYFCRCAGTWRRVDLDGCLAGASVPA